MHEASIQQDFQIWLRYLTSRSDKYLIDISALNKLTTIVINNPDSKDLFIPLLIGSLETEKECAAIITLHIINTIVLNFRKNSKGSSDVLFLGKILDDGIGVMERNLSRNWKDWENQLLWTLFEWKLNYKIENRLSPILLSSVNSKGEETLHLKDTHFTLIEEDEMLALYLRDKGTEAMVTNLLRIFEYSYRNTEPNKDPYKKMMYTAVKGEGWTSLMNLTKRYLISSIGSLDTKNYAFRNIQNDKLALIPHVFTAMHASSFIESSVASNVRTLIQLFTASRYDISTFIKTEQYKACVSDLMSSLNHTLEHLNTISPWLCKYICEICKIIKEIKGRDDYWNEMNGLLIVRLLAPYIFNPALVGIVEHVDLNSIQLLTYTAKIVQGAWVGAFIDNGELGELKWINMELVKWKGELQMAFEKMYHAEIPSSRGLILPKTLILSDLCQIQNRMKNFEWKKCPEIVEMPRKQRKPKITIDQSVEELICLKRPPKRSPSFKENSFTFEKHKEIMEEIITENHQTVPVLQIAPPDIFKHQENHEPRIKSPNHENEIHRDMYQKAEPLPFIPQNVYAYQNSLSSHSDSNKIDSKLTLSDLKISITERSKHAISISCQTDNSHFNSTFTQTNEEKPTNTGIQTDDSITSIKSTQTDMDFSFNKKASTCDQYTFTDISLSEVLAEHNKLKNQIEKMLQYQTQESERLNKVNEYWANQYKELKFENIELKSKIKELKEEQNKAGEIRYTEPSQVRYSEPMTSRSYAPIPDDSIDLYLNRKSTVFYKCDPSLHSQEIDQIITSRKYRQLKLRNEERRHKMDFEGYWSPPKSCR
ncbi:unnamed protein product [Blepharisma stoltei]|uniref:Uncharacterized protein n=1 Tax=Blepharisma stoltei TaxID=1481888 RepID=A0AAU9IY15_9CILI|nr:unnamed protein product [Blepharisma stoltei]